MNPILRVLSLLCLLFTLNPARSADLLSTATGNSHASSAGVGENFCMSADGRYVAFNSASTNLVPGDTNGLTDVFVRDCELRSNIWSSVQSRSVKPHDSRPLDITPDGRFLLFTISATNLTAGTTSPIDQLYRHDLQSNVTALVSMALDDTNASTGAIIPGPINTKQSRISADGRHVLFLSQGSDLVANASTKGLVNAFCRDVEDGITELISTSPAGLALDRQVNAALMSTNGRYFTFESGATNVVPGLVNTNGHTQVYWRDRLAQTNVLVSMGTNGLFAEHDARLLSLSRDGRHVCFNSLSTNIVSGQNDQNGTLDLFIRDVMADETWLVTRATNGMTTGQRVTGGEFSANGEWMLVAPCMADLAPGVADINSSNPDLYLHHLPTRTNILVSRSVSGLTGANSSGSDSFARLSASGRFVLFKTSASNLLAGATTTVPRLLMRDVLSGQTLNPLHTEPYSTIAYNEARFVISDDERFICFLASTNYDPTVTDQNNTTDLFRAPLYQPRLQIPRPGQPIQAQGLALASYVLQASSNLLNWTDAITNSADGNGVLNVTDPFPPGSQRYYRLRLQ